MTNDLNLSSKTINKDLILCISDGTWQALMAAVSLCKVFSNEDLKNKRVVIVHVVKESQREQLEPGNTKLFQELEVWSEQYNLHISSSKSPSMSALKNFFSSKNLLNASLLVMKSTTFPIDIATSYIHHRAKIIITDEGGHLWFNPYSMVPQESHKARIRSFAKAFFYRLKPDSFNLIPDVPKHRYLGKFTIFPEKMPADSIGPKWEELTSFDFSKVAKRVNHENQPNIISGKTVILLGSNLSEGKYLFADEEYELYLKCVNQLIEAGFYVYFKPHPRAQKLYSEYLSLKVKRNDQFCLLNDDFRVPLEALMLNWSELPILVGIMTSSLWSASKLLGAQCYTIIDDYHQKLILKRLEVRGRVAYHAFMEIPHINQLTQNCEAHPTSYRN